MDNNSLTFEEEEDIRKQIISLLLSGAKRPIKNKLNFQKELFLLTRAFPKFQSIFNFIPLKFGPYSNDAEFVIENNIDLFITDSKGLSLSEKGAQFSQQTLDELDYKKRQSLSKAIYIIRDIYDNLNTDEFMFLIYSTYGFTEKSEKVDELMKKKNVLAKRLYDKKIITLGRYNELIG